jgi:hypothetical protein
MRCTGIPRSRNHVAFVLVVRVAGADYLHLDCRRELSRQFRVSEISDVLNMSKIAGICSKNLIYVTVDIKIPRKMSPENRLRGHFHERDWFPALCAVVKFCRDLEVRREALSLLRSNPGREGGGTARWLPGLGSGLRN